MQNSLLVAGFIEGVLDAINSISAPAFEIVGEAEVSQKIQFEKKYIVCDLEVENNSLQFKVKKLDEIETRYIVNDIITHVTYDAILGTLKRLSSFKDCAIEVQYGSTYKNKFNILIPSRKLLEHMAYKLSNARRLLMKYYGNSKLYRNDENLLLDIFISFIYGSRIHLTSFASEATTKKEDIDEKDKQNSRSSFTLPLSNIQDKTDLVVAIMSILIGKQVKSTNLFMAYAYEKLKNLGIVDAVSKLDEENMDILQRIVRAIVARHPLASTEIVSVASKVLTKQFLNSLKKYDSKKLKPIDYVEVGVLAGKAYIVHAVY